jgi:hypothetical protein
VGGGVLVDLVLLDEVELEFEALFSLSPVAASDFILADGVIFPCFSRTGFGVSGFLAFNAAIFAFTNDGFLFSLLSSVGMIFPLLLNY